MSVRQLIVCAVVLGLVAGGVVWYLERFERQRLFSDFEHHLGNWAAFQEWLKEHGRD